MAPTGTHRISGKKSKLPPKTICCSQVRKFRKLTISCYNHPANTCLIEPDQSYYLHKNGTFSVNAQCFKSSKSSSKDDTILIYLDQADPTNNQTVRCNLVDFDLNKNNEEPLEPLVFCQLCENAAHAFCVKVNPGSCFTCQICSPSIERYSSIYSLSSKLIYCCPLSYWLQNKVNLYLGGCKKYIPYSQTILPVRVRVISTHWREFDVKPWISSIYKSILPTSYKYRKKAIFAFQEQADGTEICFFALFVDEYDDESALWKTDGTESTEEPSNPNSRHVNISYLDSVTYFKPSNLRRGLYYEIILGYLEFASHCGYEKAYIWSCPPSPGDDYIFYAHPKCQEKKYPNGQKLNQWYINLLDQGLHSKIISYYTSTSHQAILEGKLIHKFPYFSGDFWPKFIDNTIYSLGAELGNDEGRVTRPDEFHKLLNEKAAAEFLKYKLATFYVHLRPPVGATSTPRIFDFCPTLPCAIVERRDDFLAFCKYPDPEQPALRCEFSDERRAKYSTHRLISEILKAQRVSTIASSNVMFHSLTCPASFPCPQNGCDFNRKLINFAANLPSWHPVTKIKSNDNVYISLAKGLLFHHSTLCLRGCEYCKGARLLAADMNESFCKDE